MYRVVCFKDENIEVDHASYSTFEAKAVSVNELMESPGIHRRTERLRVYGWFEHDALKSFPNLTVLELAIRMDSEMNKTFHLLLRNLPALRELEIGKSGSLIPTVHLRADSRELETLKIDAFLRGCLCTMLPRVRLLSYRNAELVLGLCPEWCPTIVDY